MRRASVVIFPLLLATTLVVASLVAMRMNRRPDWQLELDQYVEYKDSLSSGTTTVQLVDRATPFSATAPTIRLTIATEAGAVPFRYPSRQKTCGVFSSREITMRRRRTPSCLLLSITTSTTPTR
jgi:hypothetical protein